MKNKIKVLITSFIIFSLVIGQCTFVSAAASDDKPNYNESMEKSIQWLTDVKDKDCYWGNNNYINDTCNVVKALQDTKKDNDLEGTFNWIKEKGYESNNDQLSSYVKVASDNKQELKSEMLETQNEDGGFGLKKNYSSDIYDSLLVLESLVDSKDNQDKMFSLINYFIQNQNKDGGFGYTNEADSNIMISARIGIAIIQYMNNNNFQSDQVDNLYKLLEKYMETFDKDDLSDKSFYGSLLINLYNVNKNFDTDVDDFVSKLLETQKSNGSFNDNISDTILAIEFLNKISEREDIVTEISDVTSSLNIDSVYIKNKTEIIQNAKISYYSNFNKDYVLKTSVYDGDNVINSNETQVFIDKSKSEVNVASISFDVNEAEAKDLVIKSSLYDDKGNLVKETENTLNIKDKYVDTDVLLIQDTTPWNSNANETVLNSLGVSYDKVSISGISTTDLFKYRVVILANDQDTSVYNKIAQFKTAFEAFAKNGGTIVYGVCDGGWHSGTSASYIPGDVKIQRDFSYYNHIVDKDNPIVTAEYSDGIPLVDADLYNNWASHVSFVPTSLPEDANVILKADSGNPTLIEYGMGKGTIIASGLTWEHAYQYNTAKEFSRKALDDLFLYALHLGIKNIDEEPGIVNGTISLDKEKYTSNEDVNIDLKSEITSYKRTVQAVVEILDENDKLVKTVDDKYEKLLVVGTPDEEKYVWNTSNLVSGNYKVKVTYYDGDEALSTAEKSFVVSPDGNVSNTVTTDKDNYNANEKAVILDNIKNNSSNFIADGLKEETIITNSDNEEVYKNTNDLALIIPKNQINHSISWNIGNAVPGTYKVTSNIIKGAEKLSTSECTIIINSSKETYTGVSGKLALSKDTLDYGEDLDITATIKNEGNIDIDDACYRVEVYDVNNNKKLYSTDSSVSLALDESKDNTFTWKNENMDAGDYLVILKAVKKDGQTETLDKKNFKIQFIKDDFSKDTDMWNYMGNAYRSKNGYAVLTDCEFNQAGAMWLKKGISLPFTTSFKYKAGGGNGADGFVFMFAKKANELGNNGREMGFASGNGYGVEFDSFYNLFHGEQTSVNSPHIAFGQSLLSTGNRG